MPFNEEMPTRADIQNHIFDEDLESWLDSLDLPVGAKEVIMSDLDSYNYTEEE